MQQKLRYHHMGIPHETPRTGETYLEKYKVHGTSFDANPYGVEWLRFAPDSPLPDVVKRVPHVAFAVDDLDAALAGKEVVFGPDVPFPGLRIAFIVHDGAPIELVQVLDT
ncbi:MAG: hypothetical protein KKB50_14845 [Planctomycetes bacterium]|nr:hypothetical protein [Planctomycetota bacterium]